jgi:GT2 family glycosyltransferase
MPARPMRAHKPACSVCIANYNGVKILSDCIDSVLDQQFVHPVEIIVHDDASTDGSVDFLRKCYPQVKVISSAENVGFCRSNNRMARMARGRYLLLLNNDARLRPGGLLALYQYARSHRFGGILSLPQYDAETGELLDIGSRFDPFLNAVPNRDSENRDVGMVAGACLWIPRELWEELGGFPEWYDSLAEDLYLCFGAWNAGHAVRALSESGYDHWVGQSLGGGKLRRGRLRTTIRRRSLSERNKTFTMVIYYPTTLLVGLLPVHLILLAMEGLLLSIVKRDAQFWRRIYWPCFLALWHQRSHLVQERRLVQKKRRVSLGRLLRLFTPIPYKAKMLARCGLPEVS